MTNLNPEHGRFAYNDKPTPKMIESMDNLRGMYASIESYIEENSESSRE